MSCQHISHSTKGVQVHTYGWVRILEKRKQVSTLIEDQYFTLCQILARRGKEGWWVVCNECLIFQAVGKDVLDCEVLKIRNKWRALQEGMISGPLMRGR